MYMSGDRNWKHYLLTPAKELLLGGSIGGNDVLWFLTSLFMVQFLFNKLMKQKVPITCIALGGLTVAFLCQLIHIEKPAYLVNVSIGIMIIWPSHIDLRNNTLYGNSIYILAIVFSISGCIVIRVC